MRFTETACPDTWDYILLDAPQYSLTADGMEMSADYVVKSADVVNFVKAWYGLQVTSVGQLSQTITVPKQFMVSTQSGIVNLTCDGLTYSPWSPLKLASGDVAGTAGGTHVPADAHGKMSADYYRVSAHFSDRDPFVDERLEQGGQMGTLNTDELYWSPGGADELKIKDVDGLNFIKQTGTWEYTIKRSYAVFDQLSLYRGQVNKTRMYSRQIINGLTTRKYFEPGTVLFLGLNLTPVYVPFGSFSVNKTEPYWRIDYRFLIYEGTWNKFPRPVPGTTNPVLTALVLRVDGTPDTYSDYEPYPEAELNDLLYNPQTD